MMMQDRDEGTVRVKELRNRLSLCEDDALADEVVWVLEQLSTFELADIRSVETTCTRIATAHSDVGEYAHEIAVDEEQQADIRSFAAVVAAIAFRRAGRPKQSRQALDTLAKLTPPWDSPKALLFHLKSLTYLGGSSADLEEGLKLSMAANKLLPGSPGLLHALAEFKLENAIWNPESSNHQKELLHSAFELVDEAIIGQRLLNEPWAKFHFTRSRIMLRKASTRGEFDAALRELDKAIGKETFNTIDSSERRARYLFEKTLAEMRWAVQDVTAEAKSMIDEEIQNQARRNQVQVVAAVGFLTSLLALLQFAAALFVAANQAANSAGQAFLYLLVSLAAMALILFGATALAVRYLAKQSKSDSASRA